MTIIFQTELLLSFENFKKSLDHLVPDPSLIHLDYQNGCLDHMSLAKLLILQVSEGWEEGYVSFQYSKLLFKRSSVRIDSTPVALTIWD